jgi:hypothetical protein
MLVGARARAIRLQPGAEAGVAKETLRLRRLRLAGLDLNRNAGQDGGRREVPAFTK